MKPPRHVPPRWTITEPGQAAGRGVPIVLEPGTGFGDGTHPTTRLCLQAISALAPREPRRTWRLLDFGSGSGILAIAAARLGASVEALEIDPQAISHATRNFARNRVEKRVHIGSSLDDVPGPFDLVVANILRAVLLEFADRLVKRLAPDGALLLSGLVATDVPEVSVRYQNLLHKRRPEIYRDGEWRALLWRPGRG